MSERNKENQEKVRKMTLKGYYSQLPDATHPKTDFVNEVAIEAGSNLVRVGSAIFGARNYGNVVEG